MPPLMTRSLLGFSNATYDDASFVPDAILVGLGGDNDENTDRYSKLTEEK